MILFFIKHISNSRWTSRRIVGAAAPAMVVVIFTDVARFYNAIGVPKIFSSRITAFFNSRPSHFGGFYSGVEGKTCSDIPWVIAPYVF